MPDALAPPAHGGDVAAVAARYGAGTDAWLDFSANVNPDGPPRAVLAALVAGARDAASLMRYPSARDRALQQALAAAHGIEPSHVIVANGAAALVEAFVRTVEPRRCLVPQPAFSEYARALAAQRCEIVPFLLAPARGFVLDPEEFIAALVRERPDACIVTNPHNPSGALLPRAAMETIFDAARASGTAMLIDEAFVDYVPEASVVDLLQADNVLVLRSLTKLYAMPALRVGYGVARPAFAVALAGRVPSWPVTSLAADAAIAALGDREYVERTRRRNARRRERLAAALRALSLTVFESSANFLLFSAPLPSSHLADRLARNHRIVVRDCATYRTFEDGGYVRVAVRSDADNAHLVAALAAELATA